MYSGRRSPAGGAPGLLLLIVLTMAGRPADAQEATLDPDERAELAGAMDRLADRMAALEQLEARIAAARELQAEKALRSIEENGVTETIGPIRVRRAAGTAPVAPAIRAALADYDRFLGAPATLPPIRINLYPPEALGPLGRPSSEGSGTTWYAHTDRGMATLRRDLRARVLATLPPPLGPWSGGAGWRDEYRPLSALREMARITTPDGVQCLRSGDMAACRRYLFLDDDGSEEAVVESFARYYTADRIRTLEEQGVQSAVLRCVSSNRRIGIPIPSSGCLRMVATIRSRPDFMARSVIRGSLVAYALRRGGPGATERLRALPGGRTVGDQLAALSGMSSDRLVEAWRDDAMNGRSMFEGVGGNPPGPVSLLWAGGFALLALGSTRWRLG